KNINFILLFTAAAANIVLNYFLIKAMSINGAAIASMISYLLCGISFLVYFVKTTKTSPKELLFIKKEDVTGILRYIRK
ncbi:MAG: polysaccharide biosynthesis C-terminal domain-containing protein, partial [Clostridia bacterium]|nr:polysaccharide biosynthesis C-terminal domain-containing protein [Clostridia bacterium]